MLLLILGKIIDYKKKEAVAAYDGKWKVTHQLTTDVYKRQISEQPAIFSHIIIWGELLLLVKTQ